MIRVSNELSLYINLNFDAVQKITAKSEYNGDVQGDEPSTM
jgi:hypothetical protein